MGEILCCIYICNIRLDIINLILFYGQRMKRGGRGRKREEKEGGKEMRREKEREGGRRERGDGSS